LEDFTYNYSYFPVLFKDEETLLRVKNSLLEKGINCRRYFYPSLNKLPFLNSAAVCPTAESVSLRVLSLPLYPGLDDEIITTVAETIISESR
jgi:dTDP-4-amino-4,6-dideoxygalactose transaminase